jgi:hypothetical protein
MRFIVFLTTIMVLNTASVSISYSAEEDVNYKKALKLYSRLAGRKISANDATIAQMAALIKKGNTLGAAELATKDPGFYNITVKTMAIEMSTKSENIKNTFNELAASFIGVTRDQTDARELLTGNFLYSAIDPTLTPDYVADLLVSDGHYGGLEGNDADLSKVLKRWEGQRIALGYGGYLNAPNPDPAGVLTSRVFLMEHALLGTNRRPVEYAFRAFMCVGLSEWSDVGASDAYVGQDIDRFPAGDHSFYQTNCKGCHAMLDGFRGAFAKYDISKRGVAHSEVSATGRAPSLLTIGYDENKVVRKYHRNNHVFPSGYVTVDDTFVNNATRPANMALFGWRGKYQSGKGVKDFGTILANSRRFSQCMAKRVFSTVCRKDLDESTNKALLVKWGDEFEASGYKLKKLFESISVKPECLGQ